MEPFGNNEKFKKVNTFEEKNNKVKFFKIWFERACLVGHIFCLKQQFKIDIISRHLLIMA